LEHKFHRIVAGTLSPVRDIGLFLQSSYVEMGLWDRQKFYRLEDALCFVEVLDPDITQTDEKFRPFNALLAFSPRPGPSWEIVSSLETGY
jgi:hypothetical protein